MSATEVLTADEMRAAEQGAMDNGSDVRRLMERAGAAIAEAVWRIAGAADILVLCGPGNNGGDGYVAARLLQARGASVRVAAAGTPQTAVARAVAADWNGATEELATARAAPVVVDALFGTGLRRSLEPPVADRLVSLCGAAQRCIAVDLPSGVDADSGRLLGAQAAMHLTVALGALKPAHLLLPAAALCGQVSVADIGVGPVKSALHRIERPSISPPARNANKYSRGKVVVVGGAMSSAAQLAALAAQRSGAGYVELLHAMSAALPHALVQRDWSERAISDDRVGAIVIGPGLGRDRTARDHLEAVLATGKRLVLDADALAVIGRARRQRLTGHVLTPHQGEFSRMFGHSGVDRLTQARAAAASSGAVMVLKGADTVVAHPDGRAAIASLAPSWLASAGTGDVLAGVIGSLLAGGHDPFEAAQAGVWLHADAARRAGPALIADDVIAHLPAAVAACL